MTAAPIAAAPDALARLEARRGERVRVHYNIPHRCWSITALTEPDKRRVIAHVDDVVLDDTVDFIVSEAGWRRCNRNHTRDVHAWCEGRLQAFNSQPTVTGLLCVTYHYQRGPFFYIQGTCTPVTTAPEVVLARPAPGHGGYAWITR